MATRSRTYKATDWQVWTYVPTPGVLRLDFSKWDDGSDWGSTGGSIAPIDLPISQIEITDDFEPQFGISQISAGTSNIVFQIENFDKAIISEFYTGKPIYITLKNEETTRLHPVFGQNTPIFSGYISAVNFVFNTFNVVQSLVISVTDSMQYLFNTKLSVTKRKNDEFDRKWFDIADALLANTTAITRPIECLDDNYAFYNFSVGAYDLPTNISYQYETAGNQTASIGEWIQDMADTLSGRTICAYRYAFIDVGTNEFTAFKSFQFNGLSVVNSVARTLDIEKVVSINVGNSYPDKPSVFELATAAGTTYSFGVSVADSSNQVITYNQSLNSPFADLPNIVTAMIQNKNWISPTEITIELARENQQITFDDYYNSKYLYPSNLFQCSGAINLDLTSYGFESADSYSYVTGRTISISKENVLVTYKTKRTE